MFTSFFIDICSGFEVGRVMKETENVFHLNLFTVINDIMQVCVQVLLGSIFLVVINKFFGMS